ncbi:MAG: rRNA maturation RNase YbeY [Candidatus Hydrogenedentes bacterium]|jgi:probable rRNA maturation factor|nr:rRNA maturation RNase YbeY [Candidatus Hydrogenedentota bacterium]
MKIHLAVQQASTRKRLFRKDALERLAARICAGEGVDAAEVEVSVLFCDDAEIKALNKAYRGKNKATDVLSFEQEADLVPGVRVLGDIVISLETVEGRGEGSPEAMRDDVRLLFCHGMLHLLGYDHATAAERRCMTEKQALYLGVNNDAAWRTDP